MRLIHLTAYAMIASFSTFHCEYSELAKILAEWAIVWSLTHEVLGEHRFVRLLRTVFVAVLVLMLAQRALHDETDVVLTRETAAVVRIVRQDRTNPLF